MVKRSRRGKRRMKPRWDAESHELRYGNRLVKTFHRPADNQWLILAAFEEQRWKRRIDDPLPPVHGLNPKERLHATIKRLNGAMINRLIHFRGDGTGTGIIWERVR